MISNVGHHSRTTLDETLSELPPTEPSDYPDSPALQLTNRLLIDCRRVGEKVAECSTILATLRASYDRQNAAIHERALTQAYPSEEELMNSFESWDAKIRSCEELSTEVAALQMKTLPSLDWLKKIKLSQTFFAHAEQIHPKSKKILHTCYSEFHSKVKRLDECSKQMSTFSDTCTKELPHIKQHPHARLWQIIQRVKTGQKQATSLGDMYDRTMRNTPLLAPRIPQTTASSSVLSHSREYEIPRREETEQNSSFDQKAIDLTESPALTEIEELLADQTNRSNFSEEKEKSTEFFCKLLSKSATLGKILLNPEELHFSTLLHRTELPFIYSHFRSRVEILKSSLQN
jgi:hypothetical protein